MGRHNPGVILWVRDKMEWALAEEFHIKQYRRDETVVEHLMIWADVMLEFSAIMPQNTQ